MSDDIDPGPELDTIYTGLGWRTYEEAFGDRAGLARVAARSNGEHGNRAHTRGDLLSPSLIDLLRRVIDDPRQGHLPGPASRPDGLTVELDVAEVASPRSFVGKPVLDARGQQVGEVVAEARAPDGSTQLTTRLQLSGLVRCDEPPKVSVRFDVGDNDDAASRIAALLEALGFESERVGLTNSLTWRIGELARRCHLTHLERRVLELWVADRNNAQIAAELGLTRQTVKWHTHNLLGKTKAGTRQGLLTMLLGAAASDEDMGAGHVDPAAPASPGIQS